MGCWEEPAFGQRRAGLEPQLCLRGVPAPWARVLPPPRRRAGSRDDLHTHAWQTAEHLVPVGRDVTRLHGSWTSAFPDTDTQTPATR